MIAFTVRFICALMCLIFIRNTVRTFQLIRLLEILFHICSCYLTFDRIGEDMVTFKDSFLTKLQSYLFEASFKKLCFLFSHWSKLNN